MKNQNTSRFISSLIYIAMGLVLIIYPTVIGDTICYMLSGAAVVVGVLQIIGYAMTTVETRVLENNNGLAFGIILILLGVFICLKKELVISMIPFILGFMIAVKGVTGIQNAVNLAAHRLRQPQRRPGLVRHHHDLWRGYDAESLLHREGFVHHDRSGAAGQRRRGYGGQRDDDENAEKDERGLGLRKEERASKR